MKTIEQKEKDRIANKKHRDRNNLPIINSIKNRLAGMYKELYELEVERNKNISKKKNSCWSSHTT